jgi:chromosome segregation ATPase
MKIILIALCLFCSFAQADQWNETLLNDLIDSKLRHIEQEQRELEREQEKLKDKINFMESMSSTRSTDLQLDTLRMRVDDLEKNLSNLQYSVPMDKAYPVGLELKKIKQDIKKLQSQQNEKSK